MTFADRPFPYTLIDLTHTLEESMPSWNGGCGFRHDIKLDYDLNSPDISFRIQQIKVHAGIGTHIDAPAHCIPGGLTIEQLSLNDLAAPCVVIDVSEKAHERYTVSPDDVMAFEAMHGIIPPKSLVIIRTGWDQYWHQRDQYRNDLLFPSVSLGAAELLLQRGIVGLGIDTMSPDRPEDGFPVHAALLGVGKYIIENVANAAAMPTTGAFIMALPMKTKDGTEAPVRLIGLLPH